MPEVLGVAAFEISHPMLLLVLMEAGDAALHGGSPVAEGWRPAPPERQTNAGADAVPGRWLAVVRP
jgi:hypothetical protein